MPKIEKVLSLEIRPEQFLNNCSAHELMEVDMLIQSPRFQKKIDAAKEQQSKRAKQLRIPD